MPKHAKREGSAAPSSNGHNLPIHEEEQNRVTVLQKELAEKDLLLSLNNDIAYVKTREAILSIIHPKLKALFNTDDIFICRIDQEADTLSPFLRIAGGERKNNAGYNQIINSHFPLTDRFINTISNSDTPVLFSIDTVCSWTDAPAYARISKQTGIRECLSNVLNDGTSNIGVLTL